MGAALKHLVTFSGRARRREFWLTWFVINGVGQMLRDLAPLSDVDTVPPVGDGDAPGVTFDHASVDLHGGYLPVIFMLLSLVPLLSVCSRRLHDTGRSGLWTLLALSVPAVGALAVISGMGELFLLSFAGPLILGVVALLPGQLGPNRFGPDPKAPRDRQCESRNGVVAGADR